MTARATRVLLTRAEDDNAAWARSLRRHGLAPVLLPCISTELLDTAAVRHDLTRALRHADWLLLTSQRGVESVATLAPEGVDPRLRIATVGPATAAAASRLLGRVDYQAEGGTAERLAEEFVALASGLRAQNCVLALAENAPDMLADRIGAAGHSAVRINVYRTLPTPAPASKQAYSTLRCDAVFLASPSAVVGLTNQVEFDIAADIYTIGPSTSRAARERGLAVRREARIPSLEGLLEATACPDPA